MENKEKLESCLKLLEDVSSFTILEIDKLSDKVGGELPEIAKGDFSTFSGEEKELANRLVIRLFNSRVMVYENYIDKWDKGLFIPNEEELKALKNYQEKNFDKIVLPTYDYLKKQFPHLHDAYEKEERISKEYKEKLDSLLKNDEYRRKAEEKLKKLKEEENKKKGGDNSSPPQLSETDKQIASLQSKVQVLEEKEKEIPASDNSDTAQQQRKEIQQQIQQLKSELKEKEKEKENTQKGDNFPWKPIFIIGGGIIFVLVVILLIKMIIKKK